MKNKIETFLDKLSRMVKVWGKKNPRASLGELKCYQEGLIDAFLSDTKSTRLTEDEIKPLKATNAPNL